MPQVQVVWVRDAQEQGAKSGVFRITRTGDLALPLRVSYRLEGTARNGIDYLRLPMTVTIPAGSSSTTVRVTPRDDHEEEGDEEVTLVLVPATDSFNLVVLPDTQYYTAGLNGGKPEMFTEQTDWIVQHEPDLNLAFVLHVGDLTDGNSVEEWQRARAAMGRFDGVVPYAFAAGNHDGLAWRENRTGAFNSFFPVRDYQERPGFGGVFEPGRMENAYWYFYAGGVDWLVLVLEFGPRDVVLDWANRVAADHPQHRIILLTHALVYLDNTLHGSAPNHLWTPKYYGRENNGTHIWEKVIRRHGNICLAFNGHVLSRGVGRCVMVGDQGNRVYQMLSNYQMYRDGGAGFLRLVQLFPAEDRMVVKTYSPYLDQWFTDSDNQFEYRDLGIFPRGPAGYAIDPTQNRATLTLANNDHDPTPPTLVDVWYDGLPPVFRLQFDRAVDPATARELEHYAIVPGVVLASAELSPDLRTVRLTPAADLQPRREYGLQVSGLKGLLAGTSMPAPVKRTIRYVPKLMDARFADRGLAGWSVLDQGQIDGPSAWVVKADEIRQLSNLHGPTLTAMSNRLGTLLVWTDPKAFDWTDCVVSYQFKTTDDDGVGVLFRYAGPSDYCKLEFDAQRAFRRLVRVRGGTETLLALDRSGYRSGQTYSVRVELVGSQISAFLDQTLMFGGPVDDPGPAKGTFALYTWRNPGTMFRDVAVLPAEQSPRVTLVRPTHAETLRSADAILLQADAVDPDGEIRRVEFFVDGQLLGGRDAAPFVVAWTNAVVGVHALTVKATDDAGCVTVTAPEFFRVQPGRRAPYFLEQPQGNVAGPGDDVEFEAQVGGDYPVRFQWLLDDQPLTGETNAFLIVPHVGIGSSQTGQYCVRAEWEQGVLISNPAHLTLSTSIPIGDGTVRVEKIALPDRRTPVLRLRVAPGVFLTLESSEDLSHWQAVTNTLSRGAVVYLWDPAPASPPAKFYRVVVPSTGPGGSD